MRCEFVLCCYCLRCSMTWWENIWYRWRATKKKRCNWQLTSSKTTMLGARTPVTIIEWTNFLSKQNAHKTIERTFSVCVNSLLIDIFWSHSALRTKTHSRFPSDKQRHWHWNNIWEYKNRFWCFFFFVQGKAEKAELTCIRFVISSQLRNETFSP